MGQDKARHTAAWLFTVAFEISAGFMGQRQEWLVVTALFWAGVFSLCFGYWVEIKRYFHAWRRLWLEFLKYAIVFGSVLTMVYFGALIGTTLYRQWKISPPETFQPEDWALQNRAFVSEEPGDFSAYFKENTQVTANRILSRYLGKWYAVTGVVSDVQAWEDLVFEKNKASTRPGSIVSFQTKPGGPYLMLRFGEKWVPQIEVLNKGTRIKAYCIIDAVTEFSISLRNCQLVRH